MTTVLKSTRKCAKNIAKGPVSDGWSTTLSSNFSRKPKAKKLVEITLCFKNSLLKLISAICVDLSQQSASENLIKHY